MAVATAEPVVARRNDQSVKIDARTALMAKVVAASRDMSVAEYLSNLLAPLVLADHAEYCRRSLDPSEPPKPKGKDKGTPGPK